MTTMSLLRLAALAITAIAWQAVSPAARAIAAQRWSAARANAWYDSEPWLVGSNYRPATAINQLEMWQADTFDAATIDRELGWARGIGMNTMRVFLHNLLWEQDPDCPAGADRLVPRSAARRWHALSGGGS